MARLEAFLSSQLETFSHDKANVDRSITSRLSPWIHTGTVSVRFLYYRVRLQGYFRKEWCRWHRLLVAL
jgi:deoxyribodipyrimidine photolyase